MYSTQLEICLRAPLTDAQNRVEKHLFLTSAFWATTGDISQGKPSSEAHPSTGACSWKMTWPCPLLLTVRTHTKIKQNMHRGEHRFQACARSEKFAEMNNKELNTEFYLIVYAQLTGPDPEVLHLFCFRRDSFCVMCNLTKIWMWDDCC